MTPHFNMSNGRRMTRSFYYVLSIASLFAPRSASRSVAGLERCIGSSCDDGACEFCLSGWATRCDLCANACVAHPCAAGAAGLVGVQVLADPGHYTRARAHTHTHSRSHTARASTPDRLPTPDLAGVGSPTSDSGSERQHTAPSRTRASEPNTVTDRTHHSMMNRANGSDVISMEFLRPLEYRDTVLLPDFERATKVSIAVRVAMAAEPENCSYRVVLRGIFSKNVSLTVVEGPVPMAIGSRQHAWVSRLSPKTFSVKKSIVLKRELNSADNCCEILVRWSCFVSGARDEVAAEASFMYGATDATQAAERTASRNALLFEHARLRRAAMIGRNPGETDEKMVSRLGPSPTTPPIANRLQHFVDTSLHGSWVAIPSSWGVTKRKCIQARTSTRHLRGRGSTVQDSSGCSMISSIPRGRLLSASCSTARRTCVSCITKSSGGISACPATTPSRQRLQILHPAHV